MIHIIIPVFNRWQFTKSCLDCLKKQTYKEFIVIVVDHGSTDGTRETIEKDYPWVTLILGNQSMWWTAATNMGVEYSLKCDADFILTLNNDLIMLPDYLEKLIVTSKQYKNVLVGSISIDSKNCEKVVFAGTKWNPHTAKYKSVLPKVIPFSVLKIQYPLIVSDLLPGRGVLIPSEAFRKVGLYDVKHFPHYAADEDFSRRCFHAGYNLLVNTGAPVFSEVEATGLKQVHNKRSIKFIIDNFYSIKSPNKLSVRWNWAIKHGKPPLFYFICDLVRITVGQLFKPYR